MDIKIVKNQEEGAKVAFEVFKEAYENGAKVFGLATGSSPLGLYEKIRQSSLDFSDRVSVNLDEYAGLSSEDKHSYHYFMNEQLFAAKPFLKSYLPRTHKVALAQATIEANKRFFEREEDVPRYAYSMGLQSIMDAKQILLIAFGEKKAKAILNTVKGEVTTDVPASILQKHPNVTIIVDEAAASLLTR